MTLSEVRALSTLTIGLALDCVRFGTKKLADLTGIETQGADKRLLTLHKVLLESKALSAIEAVDRRAQRYLRRIGLACYLREGMHRVPVALVTEIEGELQKFADERGPLIERFRDEYPAAVERMRDSLGPQFRDKDYPAVDRVIARLAFEWYWFPLDEVPTKMREIDPVAYRRAMRHMRRTLERAIDDVRQGLAADARKVLDVVLEKLAGKDDGKAKQFHQSQLLTDLEEYLRTYAARNVTSWPELTTEIEKLRGLVAGVDVDATKKDLGLQQQLHAQLTAIGTAVDGLLERKGTRVIHVDELEA